MAHVIGVVGSKNNTSEGENGKTKQWQSKYKVAVYWQWETGEMTVEQRSIRQEHVEEGQGWVFKLKIDIMLKERKI